MRVETQRKLFAGVRIDSRMREQLEKCPQRDRLFFESTDGRYLTVLRGGEDTYLGKVLDAATPLASIDDVRRNVWSILQRICPGRRDEKEVKLFAVNDEEPTLSRRPGSGGPGGGLGAGDDRDGGAGGFDSPGGADDPDYY